MNLFVGDIDLMCRVAVRRTKDSRDIRRLEAIFKVMIDEQVCRRDSDRAYLMKPENREPELIMSFQNEHNLVALFDAERFEVVRRLT